MNDSIQEVLDFIEESDVKFVRLAFCDLFGSMKNVAIMANELPKAFKQGVSFDVSNIRGFSRANHPDLYLHPDVSTLSLLPWRPQQSSVIRFFCDVSYEDGAPFYGNGRAILKHAIDTAAEMGYTCKIGTKCEFYLFEMDERGKPTRIPHDDASYLDVAPLDRGENVRRDISLTLEQMGTKVHSSHHESGPGQNEISLCYNDTLMAADDFVAFKNVARTIAALNGLFASFMPKPLEGQSGSGMHISVSLHKNGENLFGAQDKTQEAQHFMAGILNRLPEITVFLNPITNSYNRFGSFEVPRQISWSRRNCFSMVRVPRSDEEHSRVELRGGDPSCNPYLAYAMILYAGLEGIKNKEPLCDSLDIDFLKEDEDVVKQYQSVPETLGEAIKLAQESEFVNRVLPDDILAAYLSEKRAEWRRYKNVLDKGLFEQEHYFRII